MANKKKKKSSPQGKKPAAKAAHKPIRREVGGVVCAVLAVVSLLGCCGVKAFFTEGIANLSLGLIGAGLYILPLSFVLAAFILFLHDGRPVAMRVVCAFTISVLIGSLVHLFSANVDLSGGFGDLISALYEGGKAHLCGGVISGGIAILLEGAVSKVGAVILLVVLLILSLLTGLNMTVRGIITAIRQRPRAKYDEPKREHPDPAKVIVDHVAQKHIERAEERKKSKPEEFDIPVDDPILPPIPKTEPTASAGTVISPDEYILKQREEARRAAAEKDQKEHPECKPAAETLPEIPEEAKKLKHEDVQRESQIVAKEIEEKKEEEAPSYLFPPVDLLLSGDGRMIDGTEEMRLNTQRLNDTLVSFGIEAKIINVIRGPSVTRYEIELDRGVKLSKITSLADDIALQLGAQGVRIAAIPNKISVVGIEVPNREVSTVTLRDVIASDEFTNSKSTISFAVGKDIGGACIVGNIAKLPHMLIAGTTGSGKSVCMNSLIISLLYKSTPEQVRLIMIDPKMVELGVYNGIPHLLIPVVTDPKKAAGSLQWAVWEMMRRYRMMADAGVRDLDSFNNEAQNNDELETMPQIVVVIDELADLMLAAAKEVEESICRVAQMGRAAGIHLIIATQRPSADVITGLMKANIPSRIAFAVASAMESRIILDAQGAEKLVGKGDMLYSPLGQGKPCRVQGCYVSEGEVQKVVDFVSKQAEANYDSKVIEQIDKNAAATSKTPSPSQEESAAESEYDEMLPQAVDVILEVQQASTSMLQRRLKLGYARAARIIDDMEKLGIVGAYNGSKPRDILITKEEWEKRKQAGEEGPIEELIQ